MPITSVHSADQRQLQEIADILAKSKKIIVVTGAGISTNSGIPDFRSENGLYSIIQSQYDKAASQGGISSLISKGSAGRLRKSASSPAALSSSSGPGSKNLPTNVKGKDLFDSRIWNDPFSTSTFYTFISSLRRMIQNEVEQTTATHKFIRTLRDGGRLVRCYTQNIDGLEARDGLSIDLALGKGNKKRFTKKVVSRPRPEGVVLPGSELDGGCEVVQLHGDLEHLRCTLCLQLSSWEVDDEESFMQGVAPVCRICTEKDDDRRGRGKRGTAVGSLRPNIVLYGEEHPSSDLLSPITENDLKLGPDVLLILGTSLKVYGLKILVREFAKAVHDRGKGKGRVIFVNLTKPAESAWNDVIDYWVGMDCDAWVDDLKERRKDLWLRQGELRLSTVKDVQSVKEKGKKMDKAYDLDEKENVKPRTKAKKDVETDGRRKALPNETPRKIIKGRSLTATPEKAKKRSPLKVQLPTPPNSGASGTYSPSKRARGYTWDIDDEEMPPTPSKRKRPELRILEDMRQLVEQESMETTTIRVEIPVRR